MARARKGGIKAGRRRARPCSVIEGMDIVFTQTSDPTEYLELLLATSRTVRAYCARHDCAYESYIGVKRGFWPWQATFNRIYMLGELAARGRYDWAVYMDADAFIADLGFDLRGYIGERRDAAAIMVRSGVTDFWWDVNAGVLLLNLRHPVTRRLLEDWRAAYEAIPEETLRGWSSWSNPNDQEMLHGCLRRNESAARSHIHFAPPELMNSPRARFLPQMLSGAFPDAESRLRRVRLRVEEIVGPGASGLSEDRRAIARDFIRKVYLAALWRDPDDHGLQHFEDIFDHLGFQEGSRFLVDELLACEEHRRLRQGASVA
jgi:hypothetical protein